MNREERDLIIQAQNGDKWAYEKLVTRYDKQVLSIALKMVGNEDDAKDVYQESFIAAYHALPKFRLESDFFTWLYRIAVNKAINFKRKQMKYTSATQQPTGSDEIPDDQRFTFAETSTPERNTLNQELKFRLEEAISALPNRQRMSFILCHQQGYKIRQAAEMMSCSTGAVKSYLFRAREKMRRALTNYVEN